MLAAALLAVVFLRTSRRLLWWWAVSRPTDVLGLCLLFGCGHLSCSVHPSGAGGFAVLEVAPSCRGAGRSARAGSRTEASAWPSTSFCPAFPGRGAGPDRQPGVARLHLLHRFAFCTRLSSLEKRACHVFFNCCWIPSLVFLVFFSPSNYVPQYIFAWYRVLSLSFV